MDRSRGVTKNTGIRDRGSLQEVTEELDIFSEEVYVSEKKDVCTEDPVFEVFHFFSDSGCSEIKFLFLDEYVHESRIKSVLELFSIIGFSESELYKVSSGVFESELPLLKYFKRMVLFTTVSFVPKKFQFRLHMEFFQFELVRNLSKMDDRIQI